MVRQVQDIQFNDARKVASSVQVCVQVESVSVKKDKRWKMKMQAGIRVDVSKRE